MNRFINMTKHLRTLSAFAMAKLTLVILTVLVYICSARNVGTRPIIPFKQGPCIPASVVMKNFEPVKFFTGVWYERSSFENDINQEDGNCSGLKSRISGNKVTVLFYHFESFLWNKYTSIKGEANLNDTRTASFPLAINYGPTYTQEIPIRIIDTDYEHYAILYSCRPVPGSSTLNDEMAWTFTRKRGDATNDGLVDKILKSSGLDPAKFTRYGPMTCPADEPIV